MDSTDVWQSISLVVICILHIRQLRAETRMHMAHAKMINFLLDNLIEDKKGQILELLKKERGNWEKEIFH